MNLASAKTFVRTAATLAALGLVTACSNMSGMMGMRNVALTGGEEVPPVSTAASGYGSVWVNAADKTVHAKVTVTGMKATAAHIHQGAAGANGPVIVPFTRTGDDTFEAPAATKLTDAQYDAYKAGNTYVNVHSAAHPGGEVRSQLKP